MTVLSSIEYPHWLMIAGTLLLVLGLAGLAWGRRHVAESHDSASEQEPPVPEADEDQVQVHNRVAKEKRRDRWAERFGDCEEPSTLGEELRQGSK